MFNIFEDNNLIFPFNYNIYDLLSFDSIPGKDDDCKIIEEKNTLNFSIEKILLYKSSIIPLFIYIFLLNFLRIKSYILIIFIIF